MAGSNHRTKLKEWSDNEFKSSTAKAKGLVYTAVEENSNNNNNNNNSNNNSGAQRGFRAVVTLPDGRQFESVELQPKKKQAEECAAKIAYSAVMNASGQPKREAEGATGSIMEVDSRRDDSTKNAALVVDNLTQAPVLANPTPEVVPVVEKLTQQQHMEALTALLEHCFSDEGAKDTIPLRAHFYDSFLTGSDTGCLPIGVLSSLFQKLNKACAAIDPSCHVYPVRAVALLLEAARASRQLKTLTSTHPHPSAATPHSSSHCEAGSSPCLATQSHPTPCNATHTTSSIDDNTIPIPCSATQTHPVPCIKNNTCSINDNTSRVPPHFHATVERVTPFLASTKSSVLDFLPHSLDPPEREHCLERRIIDPLEEEHSLRERRDNIDPPEKRSVSVVLIPCPLLEPQSLDTSGVPGGSSEVLGDAAVEREVLLRSERGKRREGGQGVEGGGTREERGERSSVLDCIAQQILWLPCGAPSLLATRFLTKHHPKIRLFSPIPPIPALSSIPQNSSGSKQSSGGIPEDPSSSAPVSMGGLPLNPLASWMAGHPIYGPAVAAEVEASWDKCGVLRVDDVRLPDFFKMVLSCSTSGHHSVSSGAPLIAQLPAFFPSPKGWPGTLPKSVLLEFCQRNVKSPRNPFHPLAPKEPKFVDLSSMPKPVVPSKDSKSVDPSKNPKPVESSENPKSGDLAKDPKVGDLPHSANAALQPAERGNDNDEHQNEVKRCGSAGFFFKVEVPLSSPVNPQLLSPHLSTTSPFSPSQLEALQTKGVLLAFSSRPFASKSDAENSAALDALHKLQSLLEAHAAHLRVPPTVPPFAPLVYLRIPPTLPQGTPAARQSGTGVGTPAAPRAGTPKRALGSFLSSIMGSLRSVFLSTPPRPPSLCAPPSLRSDEASPCPSPSPSLKRARYTDGTPNDTTGASSSGMAAGGEEREAGIGTETGIEAGMGTGAETGTETGIETGIETGTETEICDAAVVTIKYSIEAPASVETESKLIVGTESKLAVGTEGNLALQGHSKVKPAAGALSSATPTKKGSREEDGRTIMAGLSVAPPNDDVSGVSPIQGNSSSYMPLESGDSFSFRIGIEAVAPELEAALLGRRKGDRLAVPFVPKPAVYDHTSSSSSSRRAGRQGAPGAPLGAHGAAMVHQSTALGAPGAPLVYQCRRTLVCRMEVVRVEPPEEEEARLEVAVFSPSLSRQRNAFALKLIRAKQPSSVIDLGCGRGPLLLDLLKHCLKKAPTGFGASTGSGVPTGSGAPTGDGSPTGNGAPTGSGASKDADVEVKSDGGNSLTVETIQGLDIVQKDLEGAGKILLKALQSEGEGVNFTISSRKKYPPASNDGGIFLEDGSGSTGKSGKKSGLKRVQLFQGSLADVDARMMAPDLVTCIEVVEHLDEAPLAQFGPAVLGGMRPKRLLVSTPNFEYNALIVHHVAKATGVMPSSPSELGSFRNADHRFEWTRAEFEAWASDLARKYSYAVEFFGVGELEGGKGLGFATQIALFEICEDGSGDNFSGVLEVATTHQLVWECYIQKA